MEYHAPETLGDALDILSRGGVTVVAGGTDFYPSMRPGGPRGDLLDITRVAGLRGIARQAGGWRIGAATRWSEIARADLPRAFDGLKAAARKVGGLQIQNAGTVAGNLVNASPAADGVPPLLTLGAQVEIAGPGGTRRVALEEFITGVRQVALDPGEMVVAVHMPEPPTDAAGAFCKLGSRAYLVISIAMVAVVLGRDEEGRIDHARVAVGACSPVARRLPALEAAMIGARLEELRIDPAHLAPLSPIDDVRGSGAYRLEAVSELIGRALREAAHG
ncbi:FAD binding domain-containing protein [Marimonas lutisalis]|uniref:FAD binding domain-containing protein n=1 Tax=Marimonas lutisalis TaxID=2545756 RepID=UPI0010F5F049|nr:xanthine dehydrogenase family protein subunit M [Marimonas lutisalis]